MTVRSPAYHLDVVPQFWFLTKRAQSRIFQQVSVPQILQQVLAGLDVSYDLRGTYQPRDYCVQYRETDFDFACRLMEEEGIFYFFKHTANGHTMVVADTPQSLPDVPGRAKMTLDAVGGGGDAAKSGSSHGRRRKSFGPASSRSGTIASSCRTSTWKPTKPIADSVPVGTGDAQAQGREATTSSSSTTIPASTPSGSTASTPAAATSAGDLQKIFEDNKRTVEIRMQEEAAAEPVDPRRRRPAAASSRATRFALDNHYQRERQVS